MPIAYAGMLSMKKFAKCSAAMTMSASGRASRRESPRRCSSAWSASFEAGSARGARPVIPGAWLHTPAKTRLTTSFSSDAGDLLVGRRRHRIDAGAHRAVPTHAFAHRLDVVGPRQAEQRREVHQQLAVGPEHVELAH